MISYIIGSAYALKVLIKYNIIGVQFHEQPRETIEYFQSFRLGPTILTDTIEPFQNY